MTTLGRTLGFSLRRRHQPVRHRGRPRVWPRATGGSTCRVEYQAFDNVWIIGIALALYVVEFFADKIPWLDSLWDAVHTVVRPLGGAFIAVTDASARLAGPRRSWLALIGGTVAASSHFTKAGTRVAGQQQPRAVLELAAQLRRRRLRGRPGIPRPAPSRRRAHRQHSVACGDPGVRHLARASGAAAVCTGEARVFLGFGLLALGFGLWAALSSSRPTAHGSPAHGARLTALGAGLMAHDARPSPARRSGPSAAGPTHRSQSPGAERPARCRSRVCVRAKPDRPPRLPTQRYPEKMCVLARRLTRGTFNDVRCHRDGSPPNLSLQTVALLSRKLLRSLVDSRNQRIGKGEGA